MNRFENMDRRLLTILLVVFVQMVGASMVLPIFPLMAQRQFELSPQIITILISSFFAAQFLAGPIIGRLSDHYGRVPVLIISQIGTAISFVMIGLADAVWILFLARILDGITGGNIIVAQAYITDIMPKEKRTQALGYIFAAFGLGFIVGPAIGGILSSILGTQLPFLFAAVAASITVIITWRVLDESLSDEQRQSNRDYKASGFSPREVITNIPLTSILVIAFISQFGFGMLQSTFALYGEAVIFKQFSESTISLMIGLLLATIGLTQFLTQTFILQRALAYFGESMLVILGTLLRAIGMLGYAVIFASWMSFPAGVLFALGSGIMMPSLQSLTTVTVPDELRGGVLGLYQSSISLATIFSTALAGTLFAMSPSLPYWISSFFLAIVALPMIWFMRWRKAQDKEKKKPFQPATV